MGAADVPSTLGRARVPSAVVGREREKGGATMNLIVLGGAGDMGSRAVEDLARAPGVERVTIADRSKAAASACEPIRIWR